MSDLAVLADHVDLLTGFPFKSAHYSQDVDDVRLVRGDNVVQGTLRWDNAARWPRTQTSAVEEYELRPGDVVLAMDRPWIEAGLKYARIGDLDVPSLLVQRVSRLRAKASVDQGFLFYLIGSQAFTDHVLAVQTGTAVPHISGKQILSFEFTLPPIDEQRAIAAVLGSLDDKIEQDRRTGRKLEALARAVFKAWFVDFEPVKAKAAGATASPGMPAETFAALPTRLVDSELGPVPEGWQVKPLSKVAEFLNGLALQKFPPIGDGSDLPVIKIAELRKGSTDGAGLANASIPKPYIIHDGDLLFSWSGTLEVEFWFGGPGALNQHLFKVTSTEYPQWLCYHWVRQHLPEFRVIASSKATTMGHIKRGHLDLARVVVPDTGVLTARTAVIGATHDLIANLAIESRKLAGLRDYLLPRLLSGRVRVGDVNNK
jgi:type I restriction enzyme, S subunit